MSNINVKTQNSKLKTQNSEKGVSIYLALIIMSVLLAIALGISTIILSQMKMITGMGDSVVALYAADTGIEVALDDDTPDPHYGPSPLGDASYEVDVVCCDFVTNPDCRWNGTPCPGLPIDSTCNASYLCYKSVGTYRGIRRAIEATR